MYPEFKKEKWNLVKLFPEEHLIAHLLLVKIYPRENKMIYSANLMTNTKSINNKKYGWVKREFSKMDFSNKQKSKTRKKALLQFYKENEHHAKETIWINDGVVSKRHDMNIPIPKGFKEGRVMKERKPTAPPLTIYNNDDQPIISIISNYQKTLLEIGFPKRLYETALEEKTLFENSRPSDIKRLTNNGNIKFKGWYARFQ